MSGRAKTDERGRDASQILEILEDFERALELLPGGFDFSLRLRDGGEIRERSGLSSAVAQLAPHGSRLFVAASRFLIFRLDVCQITGRVKRFCKHVRWVAAAFRQNLVRSLAAFRCVPPQDPEPGEASDKPQPGFRDSVASRRKLECGPQAVVPCFHLPPPALLLRPL